MDWSRAPSDRSWQLFLVGIAWHGVVKSQALEQKYSEARLESRLHLKYVRVHFGIRIEPEEDVEDDFNHGAGKEDTEHSGKLIGSRFSKKWSTVTDLTLPKWAEW